MSQQPAHTRHAFQSFDGQSISYLRAGPQTGKCVLLVHGFVSDAAINWVKGGTVSTLAAAGFHVLAPDLRGHGQSAKPHDDSAYPDDVLSLDQEALLHHAGITRYHLAGYSLGAITAGRMIARGAKPESVILSGMGEGITRADGRKEKFVQALMGQAPDDDPFAKMVTGFVKRTGGDALALAQVMRGRKAVSAEALAQWQLPCMVLNGAADKDNGSGDKLAAMIPNAQSVTIDGNHMDAIFKPEFARAIAGFLAQQSD
jgi:pimeloyl-ACP methyl ester carboxylesterase